jgi:UDP-N-acetylglucosamine diphosphorylase/glucosamine-1-phosphate N-acetyltransferase
MYYVLFDGAVRDQLLPFTHTRPVADIRCGIMTMRQRWEMLLQADTATLTQTHLRSLFPYEPGLPGTWVNGAVFGTKELADAIRQLPADTLLEQDGLVLAAHTAGGQSFTADHVEQELTILNKQSFSGKVLRLQQPWDIFSLNEQAIALDYALLTEGRSSQPLPDYVTVMGKEQVFVEPGAVIAPCIINAAKGPVYIGKDAEIMEGCMVRGPFALGEHAVLKMGAKVYGATTIGDGCKVGGEISNVVFFANSNKGHDGFLGNAVIGEWCNLGADTNCSNLKNNYDTVKVWSESKNQLESTGLQFCGLLMGDHSKCGINTMFNTGTVVGVSANIYGGDFPEKFVPSFSWGGSGGMTTYSFDKAMDTARRMMARRNLDLSEAAEAMYHHIFTGTAIQRTENHQ